MIDFLASSADATSLHPTPLEQAEFRRFSTSAEMTSYLYALAATSPHARCEIWGYSVQGKPLTALQCRNTGAEADAASPRLRVLLVGTQHGGSEAGGGEALMVLARQLLHEDLQPLLESLDVYILANANPDGRDADISKNANEVNLNRDYVLLSQPESRALDRALARIRPHVVLDAHESAALKRKTLGQEGYMTEFQVQYDTANNPAVSRHTQDFCERVVLNPLIEGMLSVGIPAQRYIREIASIKQPLTHGGVTAQVFRNKAGVCGALSFLLETRMDPKEGRYSSFRNIRVRRRKQLFCMREFLMRIGERKADIIRECENNWNHHQDTTCILNADFIEHPEEPVTRLPLRRIDTQEVTEIEFINHRHIRLHAPIARPRCYYVTQNMAIMMHILKRHSLSYAIIERRQTVPAIEVAFPPMQVVDEQPGESLPADLQLQPGYLCISLAQQRGALLPQLLEPQSTSSLFRYPQFLALRDLNHPFFIYRGYDSP